MTRRDYEYRATVDTVAGDLAEADSVLRVHGINRTTRYSLANVAAATLVNTDELMARLEYRARRAAARTQPQQEQPAIEFKPMTIDHLEVDYEREGELVA